MAAIARIGAEHVKLHLTRVWVMAYIHAEKIGLSTTASQKTCQVAHKVKKRRSNIFKANCFCEFMELLSITDIIIVSGLQLANTETLPTSRKGKR